MDSAVAQSRLDGFTIAVFFGGFVLGLVTSSAVSNWVSLRGNGKYYSEQLRYWRR